MTTLEGLNCAGGEPVLDFSSIDRIDAAAARALEELADRSVRQDHAARRERRGLSGAQLLKLAHRFSFVS